jgi:ribosome recycling factor
VQKIKFPYPKNLEKMSTDAIMERCRGNMDKAISHLEDELLKIRTGKANPAMLDSVYVEYYGSNVPLQQVANVNTPDGRTLTVQPWEKKMLQDIERAIINSNLNLNPQNDGEMIRIHVPPLTEERRKDMVKMAKAEAENAKVSLRNARRDANEGFKKLVKEGLAEDVAKDLEARVQKMIDEYTVKVEDLCQRKEKEIMTV